MYDKKAIQARIDELLKEGKALNTLAQDEERELTSEESARFDAILAEVGERATDEDKASGLYAKLETADKFARLLAGNRHSTAVGADEPQRHTDGGWKVPRAALAHGSSLKAFVERDGRPSDQTNRDAYLTGRFLLAQVGHQSSVNWIKDNTPYASQLEGDNAKGGFLVPVEMSTRLIDLREQYGVFRRNTYVEPMGSETKTVSRRKSGLTAYAVGEANAITESEMQFSQVELTAKVWGVLTKISRELDEDSAISVADKVVDEMAYAFAIKEDQAGFIGDGTSTYGGVTGVVTKCNDGNHAASLSTATTGNTAFSTLDLADFEAMVGQLPQYAEIGAAWYISKVGYWQSMARLMNAVGGNTMMDLGRGPELTFLGYPVRISQVMNSTTAAQTSTAGLCLFGNLSLASTMGNRRGFGTQVLNELYAVNQQIGIVGTTRFAINVHDVGDGSTTGPMVCLKTPAS